MRREEEEGEGKNRVTVTDEERGGDSLARTALRHLACIRTLLQCYHIILIVFVECLRTYAYMLVGLFVRVHVQGFSSVFSQCTHVLTCDDSCFENKGRLKNEVESC